MLKKTRVRRRQALRNQVRRGFEQLEDRRLMAAKVLAGEFFADELLVQFAPNTNAAAQARVRSAIKGSVAEVIHTRAMQAQGLGRMERLSIPSSIGMERAMEALSRNPFVVYAEPNYIYRPTAVSNDTYYTNGSLWGMFGDDAPTAAGPSGTTNQFGSHAEKAWSDNITGSSNIVVGIIDEGVQVPHPDLNDNMWVNPYEIANDGIDNDGNGYVDDIHGWDFVYNNNSVYDAGEDAHGTHVAGTIGGEGGNGSGVVGVNWDVTMIALKFLGPNGGSTANAVKALDYLTDLKNRHGINIVASNNSWGGGGYSQALHDAIIRSAKKDILFVAAAGNSTSNNDATASYPSNYNTTIGTSTESAASYDSVIAVASITNTGAISSFSSYGATTVDIGAPGSGIWSSVPSNTYASYNGTSMATPHVTGAVALYASAQPGPVAASSIKAAILDSATPTSSLAGKTATGGRLNVYEAMKRSAYIDLDRDVYGLPGTATITVNHATANANTGLAETLTVNIHSTTESSPESVLLTETGVNTGRFVGTIAIVAGTAAADGSLQANHNDQITVTYPTLNQPATAVVDGLAPSISNLAVTPAATSAQVRWLTDESSTTEVVYGTSAANLNRTFSNLTPIANHTANLAGLAAGTTYYYQVRSRDAAGNLATSAVSSFTTVSPAPILFVDDDQGETFERFFQNSLAANSYAYDKWDVVAAGTTPAASDLLAYSLVIWNTGEDYSSSTAGLSSGEQTAIANYLNAGGRIFISGQDILYNGVSSSFRQNYLKVAAYTDDVVIANHVETGVAGNPISNGMSLSLAKPSDYTSLYVDALTPTADANGTFLHGVTTTSNAYSVVNYRGNYAAGGFGMVFSTFPFEAIANGTSPNNQNEVMRRTVEYLMAVQAPPGFAVSTPSASSTTEAEGSVSFTVALTAAPTDNVVVPISSSNSGEAAVAVASLEFTPSDWNLPQTVIVTGIDDDIDDGDQAYTIILGAAVSADVAYQGLNPDDVSLNNLDDDTRGFLIADQTGNQTAESGNGVSFTLRLTSQPLADVSVPLSSSDSSEGTVSPAVLLFTAANWNVPQTVTVQGVNDNIDDGNVAYSLIIEAATSSDPLYQGLNPADVSLTNVDDDMAGINVSSPSGTNTSEAGGQVTFTLVLTSEPTANATIGVRSNDTTEGTVSLSSVVFTSSNWNVPQTVTVTGVDDSIYDPNTSYLVIVDAASSTDAGYNGLNPADISLTNTDNDTQPVTKFFVVDDGTANRTFEYDPVGAPTENYALATANAAPRGVAANLAGDRVWVLDNNRNVYVYNASGGLLGSWTASGFTSNPLVEGITTDGIHIWIVESKADRVYYFANAASRTSGSQAATASFLLNSSNTSPKDLVVGSFNGVKNIWVVNDIASSSGIDRVFKYTIGTNGLSTGAAVTSWAINTSTSTNKAPTGITLDPSNASQDIWIVDNTTDRVLQFTNGRTAAAPTLRASFALMAGNTNPQGIADPPPAELAQPVPSMVSNATYEGLLVGPGISSTVVLRVDDLAARSIPQRPAEEAVLPSLPPSRVVEVSPAADRSWRPARTGYASDDLSLAISSISRKNNFPRSATHRASREAVFAAWGDEGFSPFDR